MDSYYSWFDLREFRVLYVLYNLTHRKAVMHRKGGLGINHQYM
jgi:hypothetical protein